MKIFTSDIGSDVIVWFLDHATNSKHPIKCKVRGEVIKVTKKAAVLRWWDLEHDDDEVREHNQETCIIVQSTITGLLVMTPKLFRGFTDECTD